ncbi:hypothetical protein H7J50_19500 [Mycobacterium intermedium]|uniref:terminase large subunit domain-containing protein n=1 Tax=Mycobacterium intermedium TaxID=28445 RepID=UPI0018D2A7DB|nr:terminase family protein [Mycobacterium intermedium]MCV6965975.1 hypothetical protein [Mycobacterium intermedium]
MTPAVALISDALLDAITQPDRRVIITCPPRESKSTTVAVVGTLFALMNNPDERVILASYADSLAWEHSRTARALVEEHHDVLGFRLSADKTSAARWAVAGRSGGLLAVGITSGVTGFGAGLLLVDDATKNAAEADSAASRARVLAEFRATLMTRVHPGGSVVIIGTRWHETDLIGSLLREEPDRWRHINIPAVAEAGIPDALGRLPGAAMTSALGRTRDQFTDLRRSVGERAWYALFQGVPSSPEGGLIKQDWLDHWRLPAAPPHPVRTVVAVDPADSGERDAAGIIAATLAANGRVHLIADATGKMTSDEWARAAIALALDVGASEIHVEAFASGATYVRIVREALARSEGARHISVRGWPPKGHPRKGDAVTRSAAMLQALETGRCVIAGNLPDFETAAVRWQAGQHQPDCIAAAVIAFDVLAPVAGGQTTIVGPWHRPQSQPPEWMTRRILNGRTSPDQLTTAAPHRSYLSRSVKPSGYDPLAYPRPTLRPVLT